MNEDMLIKATIDTQNEHIRSIDSEVNKLREKVHAINNGLMRTEYTIGKLETTVDSIRKVIEEVLDSFKALKAFSSLLKNKFFWIAIFILFVSIDWHHLYGLVSGIANIGESTHG